MQSVECYARASAGRRSLRAGCPGTPRRGCGPGAAARTRTPERRPNLCPPGTPARAARLISGTGTRQMFPFGGDLLLTFGTLRASRMPSTSAAKWSKETSSCSGGRSDSPYPRQSGAMARYPAAATASIWWRHEYHISGKPCRNTTVPRSPATHKPTARSRHT